MLLTRRVSHCLSITLLAQLNGVCLSNFVNELLPAIEFIGMYCRSWQQRIDWPMLHYTSSVNKDSQREREYQKNISFFYLFLHFFPISTFRLYFTLLFSLYCVLSQTARLFFRHKTKVISVDISISPTEVVLELTQAAQAHYLWVRASEVI